MIDLWLDDERDPKNSKIMYLFGSTGLETWVKNINDAKEMIIQGNVRSISFDNDLGKNVEQGYLLANWIEEMAFNGKISKINWKIHSRNPVASVKIRQSMENADRYWTK